MQLEARAGGVNLNCSNDATFGVLTINNFGRLLGELTPKATCDLDDDAKSPWPWFFCLFLTSF
jgi:hypothetical protein